GSIADFPARRESGRVQTWLRVEKLTAVRGDAALGKSTHSSPRGTMKKLFSTLLLVASTFLIAQNPSGFPASAQKAMNAVDAEKIRATVKYLSDDALQGRGTGQKGGDMAADWIAAQFKTSGLQPAGDNGSYFQNVNFFGVTTDPQQTKLVLAPK